MSHLRKYYLNDDLAFIYNDLLHELGVASNSNIEVLYKGSDREYYASDFEKCLDKYWEYSLMLAGRGSKFTSWTVYYGLQNVHCSVIIFAK